MNTSKSDPVTRVSTSEEFATAFRNARLCIPFESIVFSGPQGTLDAQGVLVSRGDRLFLECSPLPSDGSTMPSCKPSRLSTDDFWEATGVTIDGLKLLFCGLMPPGLSQSDHNGRVNFDLKVERFSIPRTDHITDEILAQIEGEEQARKTRAHQRQCPSVHFKVCLANIKLSYFNTATQFDWVNPFFERHEVRLDSLVGELQGWKFCFSQQDTDVVLYLSSTDQCKSPNTEEDHRILYGVITAFSVMHGCDAHPWRVEHQRNDWYSDDKYQVRFCPLEGYPRPLEGPSTISNDLQGLPTRMITTLAAYFATKSPLSDNIAKHLWQARQAASGNQLTLYSCLHLCAVLEGMVKDILVLYAGWTKTKMKKEKAVDKFAAAVGAVGISWAGQFETVFQVWKELRDDLAHGDFFGVDGAWGKDMFNLKFTICGGIYALSLATAGWKEPFDFKQLQKSKYLYYI